MGKEVVEPSRKERYVFQLAKKESKIKSEGELLKEAQKNGDRLDPCLHLPKSGNK